MWTAVLDSCRAQRMLGLLWALASEEGVDLDEDQGEQLEHELREALAGDLIRERELLRLVEVLEAAGVEARVLKGPAVAHLDYPDPAMRSFADVDLLVRPGEWDRAVAALCGDGWLRTYFEPRPGFDRRFSKGTVLTHPDRPVEVDLHRTLALGPFGLTVNLGDLWASGQAFELGGRSVTALDLERRLIHACYHAALGDLPARFVPLRDIAQMSLSGGANWDVVRDLTSRWGAEAVVSRAFELTWEKLELPAEAYPLGTQLWLDVPDRQRGALGVYLSKRRTSVGLTVASVAVLPKISDKARFVACLAFPQRSYVQQRYGGSAERWRSAASTLLSSRKAARSDRSR